MNKIRHHLEEARLVRNSAREIVKADLSNIKLMLEPQHIVHRLREDAQVASEKISDFAEENRKPLQIAGIASAAVGGIWLVKKLTGSCKDETHANTD